MAASARILTFLFLLAERLTACLWRPLTWAGLFAGLWLFEIPLMFGNPGATGALLFFIAGFLYFLNADFRAFRWPTRLEAERRLEKRNALAHRPLAHARDTLSNPENDATRLLWGLSKSKNLIRNLRAAPPQAFLAAKDPYALRIGVLLFLVLGILSAGTETPTRIAKGLTPFTWEGHAPGERNLLWIMPPEYTGLEIRTVKKTDPATLDIPSGSKIKITARGGFFKPWLDTGAQRQRFRRTDNGDYMIEIPLPPGNKLAVRQGLFPRAHWNYRVIPDNPPAMALMEKPDILPDGQMRFPSSVRDDYGARSISLAVAPAESRAEKPLGRPVLEERPVASPPGKDFPLQPVFDLTSHAWAGMPVLLTLSVKDGAGQETRLPAISMILPERPFRQPGAKALTGLRKELIAAPLERYDAFSKAIEEIMVRPRLYGGDKTVFLALRVAASRLHWSEASRETASSTAALLWDTALAIEGGQMSLAAQNLRQAQQELEKALQDPAATPQEIAQLMAELRNAMAQYFTQMQYELQKQLAQQGQQPMVPPDMLAQAIDPDALGSFLDRLEEAMQAGDKKTAQEMLAQLQQMMDMLNGAMNRPMPADMLEMQAAMNAMQRIVDRQRDLLSRTAAQPGDPAKLEKEQKALQDDLLALMKVAAEKFSSAAGKMEAAGMEMGKSAALLGGGMPAESVPHQQQALDHLEQAGEQMSQQFGERFRQMTGISLSNSGKFDPLGRPIQDEGNGMNMLQGSTVKIPAAQRKNAQEILKIIRRRAGELDRPEQELDYYRRLLKQF